MTATIDRDTLKAKLDRGDDVVLIDTLPEHLYGRKHIPGAINIVSDNIRDEAHRRIPDPDTAIIVYCGSTACQRSAKSAARLEEMGYRRVWEYVEGRQDWEAAGYPIAGAEAD